MSFLVFGSTAYLKDNCFVKIALSKLGLQTGFAFITALNQVCTELIRIRFRLDFESHFLTIEEALVKTKGTESSPSDKGNLQLEISKQLLREFQQFLVKKSFLKATSSHKSVFKTLLTFYRQYTKRYKNAKFNCIVKNLKKKCLTSRARHPTSYYITWMFT